MPSPSDFEPPVPPDLPPVEALPPVSPLELLPPLDVTLPPRPPFDSISPPRPWLPPVLARPPVAEPPVLPWSPSPSSSPHENRTAESASTNESPPAIRTRLVVTDVSLQGGSHPVSSRCQVSAIVGSHLYRQSMRNT